MGVASRYTYFDRWYAAGGKQCKGGVGQASKEHVSLDGDASISCTCGEASKEFWIRDDPSKCASTMKAVGVQGRSTTETHISPLGKVGSVTSDGNIQCEETAWTNSFDGW